MVFASPFCEKVNHSIHSPLEKQILYQWSELKSKNSSNEASLYEYLPLSLFVFLVVTHLSNVNGLVLSHRILLMSAFVSQSFVVF